MPLSTAAADRPGSSASVASARSAGTPASRLASASTRSSGEPELAHEQREHAGDDLEDGAGMALRHPAQLERAQPAADDLQGGERVDRRAGVVRRQQRREAPLVLVQQLAAPLQRRRRPRRQAAGALGQPERRAEHGVVGDEVVEQRLDGARPRPAPAARLPG